MNVNFNFYNLYKIYFSSILALKQINEIKERFPQYDEKFKEVDKKLEELSDTKEVDSVKENMSKLREELRTIKNSMADIITRLNNNRIELDDIANDLKQRRENFNLASNMASISPGARISRKGEDTAQIEQLQEDLEDLKHFTESKLLEIDIKLESLSNNSPILLNSNKNIPEGNKKQPGDRINLKLKTTIPSNIIGIPQLMKKIEEVDKKNLLLDRSFKRLLSTFNVNDVLDDIAKLKESKADKSEIPDADSFNYLLDDVRQKIKTYDVEIKEIYQRLDSILAKLVSHDRDFQGGLGLDRDILKAYLTKDEFDKNMKSRDEDLNKLTKEMPKIKDYISHLMTNIKKKAETVELNNTRGILNEKIEELARACNLKFADKNECLKNFKHIEEQLKKILNVLKRKSEQNQEGDGNWLLAKKPINGYSCASCESYIGELNNTIKKYIPWNRLPYKDTGESMYRMGKGYSKMLQMINFENNGNVNISPDNSDEIHTYVSNDSNAMNSFNIHGLNNTNNNGTINNNINNMGKTFYANQKMSQSKTPGKLRVKSACDVVDDGISSKNKKDLEENKNNSNLGNAPKTSNQKGLPKINFMLDEVSFQKDLKITRIMRKSQSKSNLKLTKKKV